MSPVGAVRLWKVSSERAQWGERPGVELVVLQVRGPLSAGEARAMADDVASRLRAAGAAQLVCEVLPGASLGVLDAVARLALVARRSGVRMRVQVPDEGLAALLALTGLDQCARLPRIERLEALGQPEAVEQRGVQEVVDVRDAPA